MKNKLSSFFLNYYKAQRKNSIKSLLNKKNLIITILGDGVTGKSFLKWCLNNLHTTTKYFIIDKKNIKTTISENQKIVFLSESYKKNCFKKSNFILPSPGFLIHKQEKWYWKIIPELDLFFYIWNKLKFESIIITGSIGKTSLTTMIHHYLSKKYDTILCGNIGYPTLDFLNKYHHHKPNKKLIAIIECSNLQLEHCAIIKVDYFILINLFENHLNMHASYQKYILSKLSPIVFEDKFIKKIIISQNAYDQLNIYHNFLLKKIKKKIIIIEEIEIIENIKINKNIIYIKKNSILKNNKILLFNIPSFSFTSNWQILVTLLSYYIKDINTFINNQPLPTLPAFRLQKIKTTSSIIIYNDSKSTIIESSLSALNQVLIEHEKNFFIFFMIGGLSKGVNRIEGIYKILTQVNQLILFGAESIQLKENLLNISYNKNHKCNPIHSFINLLEATLYTINTIKSMNKKSIVIFSPGGSSFDEFDSYIHRGEKFNYIINKLIQ